MIYSLRDNIRDARIKTKQLVDYLALLFVVKDGQLYKLLPNETDPL